MVDSLIRFIDSSVMGTLMVPMVGWSTLLYIHVLSAVYLVQLKLQKMIE